MPHPHKTTFLFFSFLVPLLMAAQTGGLCDGNLGDNIFVTGDFGRGNANVPQADPGIAPGYQYTRTTPPEDGQYTITNNTGRWTGLYDSWLRIQDNSSNPDGYMMVVNASFSPGDFYSEIITGLCENTTYEFSADIINMIAPGVPEHIDPNVSFFLDGAQQFTTGDIPQTGRWNTYGFTFVTPPGVTEMELTLRNNAPGGIGNDLAIDNISFRTCGPSAFIDTEENIFLCANANEPEPMTAAVEGGGTSLQWQLSLDQGQSWEDIPDATGEQYFHENFAVGIYQYRYLSAGSTVDLANFKCRIISDVITIEVLPEFYQFSDTICAGIPYALGDTLLTETGSYRAALISSRGCDSIVTLDLTVLPNNLRFDLIPEPPACVGENTGRLEIGPVRAANPPLVYQLDSLVSGNPVFMGLSEGSFTIRVEDRFGCANEELVTLAVTDPFRIDAGEDLDLRFGEVVDPVIVRPNRPLASIIWEPTDYLSCVDCAEPSITAVADVSYLILATDQGGCQALDTLRVSLTDREIRIYVPNAFSPNDDGVNDRFQLFSLGSTVRMIRSLQIFDRWGGLLHDVQGPSGQLEDFSWDGWIMDEPAPEGTYFYQFELELINGESRVETGSLNLLR